MRRRDALIFTWLAACAPAPVVRERPQALPMAAPTHPYADVASYSMHAHLANDHRVIDAEEDIVWTNTARVPVDVLWWHLYMNAFEGPHTLFMRTGGNRGHRGHAPGERGAIALQALTLADGEDLLGRATNDPAVADDATQLVTPLPRPVAPGETVHLHARFRTTLPHAFARAGQDRDFAFAGQWFPKLAVLEADGRWSHFPYHFHSEFYADFGRYDVCLDVPAGDVIGATGEPVGAPVSPHGRTQQRFVATRVHDFAWTAWASFRERDARAGSFALRVLYPPGEDRVASRAIAALQDAAPDFAARYGAYPYPGLTVVIPPRGAAGVGGMEYPTLITTEGRWFTPAAVHDVEWVTIHEFAHQYFQGLLASDEWSWPFLDEGLADFVTGVALGDRYGRDAEMLDAAGLRLGYWALEGAFSGWVDDAMPVATGAARFPDEASYADHVYRRTATILRTAGTLAGRDAVARALALYASRNRYAHPRPSDLLDAFRDAIGADFVEGFLRPALFDDATFDDRVDRVGAQLVATHAGGFAIATTVSLRDADGRSRTRAWTPSRDSPSFTAPAGTVSMRIDPGGGRTLDRDRLDDARTLQDPGPDRVASASAVAWWIALALRMLGP